MSRQRRRSGTKLVAFCCFPRGGDGIGRARWCCGGVVEVEVRSACDSRGCLHGRRRHTVPRSAAVRAISGPNMGPVGRGCPLTSCWDASLGAPCALVCAWRPPVASPVSCSSTQQFVVFSTVGWWRGGYRRDFLIKVALLRFSCAEMKTFLRLLLLVLAGMLSFGRLRRQM
jgi:hypothetical protein